MKKIVKIARNKLYLEGDEVLDISPDINYEMELSKKEGLSQEEYSRVTYLAAMAKSLFLLSRRDYTEKEMLKKLREKYREYSQLIKVVEKLSERGYIDDYDYTRSYIERSRDSKRMIEYKLKLKGISREVIDEVFSVSESKDIDEIKRLLPRISKREERKQIEYLMRKGFSYEDIRTAMKED